MSVEIPFLDNRDEKVSQSDDQEGNCIKTSVDNTVSPRDDFVRYTDSETPSSKLE